MTDYVNAEKLRDEYLKRKARKNVVNICTARRNWNGCDYCDVYAGMNMECWKQDEKHFCCHCMEVRRNNNE